ncbi:MAG: exonuclease domain-containing protein [Thermaurantimonas sp.]
MMLWISRLLGLRSASVGLDTTRIENEMMMAIDLETTGLDVRKDYILEAATLPVINKKLLICEAECVRIQSPGYNPHSAPIHGILHSEAETPEYIALEKIASRLHSRWLIGHHVKFDYTILKNRCRVHHIGFLPKGIIDTQRMAVKLDTGTTDMTGISSKEYTLMALCKRFRIPMEDEHTAAGDTLATALLYVKLFSIFSDKKLLIPAEIVLHHAST